MRLDRVRGPGPRAGAAWSFGVTLPAAQSPNKSEIDAANRLIVIEESERRIVPLQNDVITVGRSQENTLAIRDPRSSRFHCRLERIGGRYELVDVGSQNGTYLNGAITSRKALQEGDLIEIGNVKIFFGSEERPRPVAGLTVDATCDLGRLGPERSSLLRMHEVARALNAELDLERLLELIVDASIELTHAARGYLLLTRGAGIEVEVARNFGRARVRPEEVNLSRSVARRVLVSGEPILSLDLGSDARFSAAESVAELGLRSVLCVPVRAPDKVVGALYLEERAKRGVFTEDDKVNLEVFSAHAGVAIRNAELMNELRRGKLRIEELNRELRDRVETQEVELSQVRAALRQNQVELQHKYDYHNIVGVSRAMRDVFRLLDKVIESEVPVLIGGDSGTGKELIARAIHFNGPRKNAPFVTENCAALPDSLLESELFGYRKGAFTGADKDKKGLFEIATGGTLFLDEVGEMSASMQKKLLRVLQESEVRPIGAKDVVKINVRLISAANRDLMDLVEAGEFREDLFYRLKVISIHLPPLRDRKEDIPYLLDHFLALYGDRKGKGHLQYDGEVLTRLMGYDWPGNIRELENEVRRAVALAEDRITPTCFSEHVRPRGPRGEATPEGVRSLPALIEEAEKREIRKALEQAAGNKTRAAQLLSVSRFTLQRKLEKYHLE
ncbi:MAG: sigma 54-interacting transcriptional regulator [Planctomycetes bacterium]|nr:sigma 54-interacting transcriptional regulator [Planctomycetota bacterium]